MNKRILKMRKFSLLYALVLIFVALSCTKSQVTTPIAIAHFSGNKDNDCAIPISFDHPAQWRVDIDFCNRESFAMVIGIDTLQSPTPNSGIVKIEDPPGRVSGILVDAFPYDVADPIQEAVDKYVFPNADYIEVLTDTQVTVDGYPVRWLTYHVDASDPRNPDSGYKEFILFVIGDRLFRISGFFLEEDYRNEVKDGFDIVINSLEITR